MTTCWAVVVAAAGLIMGSGVWPFKLMRIYQFEHWWFIGMLVGLIVMPWTITLLGCPGALQASQRAHIGDRPGQPLRGGLGHRQRSVRPLLCLNRPWRDRGHSRRPGDTVGAGHSPGIQGLGAVSRLGQPEVAGWESTVLLGVGVMLVGVVMASLAGFGRDRALLKAQESSRRAFFWWLDHDGDRWRSLLVHGLRFHPYSQGPIVAQLSEVQPGSEVTVTVRFHDVQPNPAAMTTVFEPDPLSRHLLGAG